MKKVEKTKIVSDLTENLKGATSVVLIDYTGLSVKKQQDLKKRLKVVGAGMEVVKNTLFKIAGTNAKVDESALTDEVLSGPVALVITKEDPIAPLQVISKFATEFEIPNLKVGIVEGTFRGKNDLEKLAKLPSKEVLYAQVVGSVSSPLYGIVGVLNANMAKLVYILKEASEK
ncbi:MAG: 50S ribosomal protein L10 [Candidatus Woesebacteria bacterium GW2011_GWA1_37_8]|uniref:Large ribosomal subunit protein uL10 n=2 Tax=Candidatus Woeseibacteriota TaxID=1752722 RepID=A0A0G0NM27_9BACT|nr:MAG: 50S ribosomal protein L10 [Microgenomates group bacterium GW2011_GWC1_37_12b]KKQ44434.1 MAG: 50S ribosomal protein L10 [Candidatus Woesebacteria bacterium GW2011_GWA1_37_8]KKQ86974.1 MAG: 50S ribosomal protein L10 [Candidatus Woesebacteria bacterium GW2011_GWB1_38_8b]